MTSLGKVCQYCNGTGRILCLKCDGTGFKKDFDYDSSTSRMEDIYCDVCDGSGHIDCLPCQGTGRVIPDGSNECSICSTKKGVSSYRGIGYLCGNCNKLMEVVLWKK